MHKNIHAVVLVGGLILSMATPALAFSDVPTNIWYAPTVSTMVEQGIVSGYSDNTFRPQNDVTYGEAYKLVASICGLAPQGTGAHWATGYVNALQVQGMELNLPQNLNMPINRLQTAKLLAEILPETKFSLQNPYVDTTDLDVLSLYAQDIMQGNQCSAGLVFRPNDCITRAEFCTVLSRVQPLVSHVSTSPTATLNFSYPIATKPLDHANPTIDYLEHVMFYMMSHDISTYTVTFEDISGRDLEGNYDIFTLVFDAFVNIQDIHIPMGAFYNTIESRWSQASTSSDTDFTITLSNPNISSADIVTYKNEFATEVTRVANALTTSGRITSDMSQAEIARELYAYCAENYQYDYRSTPLSYNGYGLLANGKGTCQGYVSMFNALCDTYGLKIVGCSGKDNMGGDHIWSIAQLDGTTYYIDPTWGDVTGTGGHCNWSYFTDDYKSFSQKHLFEERFLKMYPLNL